MIKIFRNNDMIALLNIRNGKIAYFSGSTKKIFTKQIPDFDVYDILDFHKKDYSVFYLGFNISKTCNLNCSYCFRDKQNDDEISSFFISESIEEFLRFTPKCKKLFVDLSGDGEPLFQKKLLREIATSCISLGKKHGIEIIPMLICNGTLLTKDMVEFLQSNLVLFGVSLDGTKENHDKQRVFPNGGPTFDIISKNLLSISHNDYVGVSMVLTPNFQERITDCYLEMAEHAPTIAIRFKRNINSSDASFYRCSYKVTSGYKELVFHLIEQIRKGDFSLFFSILNGDDFFGKIFIRVFTGYRVDSPCEGGIARYTVTKNGIYPCSPASDAKVFQTRGLDSENVAIIEAIKESKKDCSVCYARFYCGGECPIVYMQRGTVDEGLCEIRRKLVDNSIEIVEYLLRDDHASRIISEFITKKILRINGL